MPGLPWTADDVAGAVAGLRGGGGRAGARTGRPRADRLADDSVGDEPWLRWYLDVARGGGVDRPASALGTRSALPELHALLEMAPAAIDGDAACHGDLRPDNMVVDPAGKVWICDWNWLLAGRARGPTWWGCSSPSHGGGGDVDAALARSMVLDGVDPEAVDAWLALLAAFMCGQAAEPAPDFASSWLAQRTAPTSAPRPCPGSSDVVPAEHDVAGTHEGPAPRGAGPS